MAEGTRKATGCSLPGTEMPDSDCLPWGPAHWIRPCLLQGCCPSCVSASETSPAATALRAQLSNLSLTLGSLQFPWA